MSLAGPSSGKDVLSRAGASFKASFGVKDDFMKNLERALSDRRQKMAVLLVDLDNVPKFYQRQSVQALAKAPFPVFVVGSARTRQNALPSKDNFHFTLALKSKDAADGILNMVAGAMQMLIAGFDRGGDVAVVPISDDRIFDQTAHTLQQGGTPSARVSRAEASRGILNLRGMLGGAGRADGRAAITYCTDSNGSDSWESDSDDSEWECDYCDKTFATARARDQHEEAKHW